MVTAYILVKANTAEADRLREAIRELDGVEQVHIIAGDVDLIVKVVVASPAEVKEIATDGIGTIPGVESTRTYVAME